MDTPEDIELREKLIRQIDEALYGPPKAELRILEEKRQAGLIADDEYERAVNENLDQLIPRVPPMGPHEREYIIGEDGETIWLV